MSKRKFSRWSFMSNLDVLVLVKDFFSLERRLIGLDLTPTGGSLYEDHMSMVKVLLMFFFWLVA